MVGDLHVHTRDSDGSQTIEQVVSQAQKIGLQYISITNHDCITDISKVQCNNSIQIIPGVELSAYDTTRKRRIHILCYLPQDLKPIEAICNITTHNRTEAGLEMAQRVSKLYPITVEDVLEIAKDSRCIYKQHIAKALMNAGYMTEIFSELYDELFDFKSGSCIVNCKQPDVYEVLDAVKQSGGISVMAHPFTYDSIDVLNELLSQNLLDGIEVWSSKSSKAQEEYLMELVNKHKLIPTGGSDFHGAYSSRISPLGAKRTPIHSIQSLLNFSNKKQEK
ncbi:PHP domain-containing protein [Paludicola sp. MB14-C6]|uniref:PHP domain-containing protein n=1 Tax=Paludihabitans sp. MB14-C6 TaxID=3070656 RepID=UPI0027DCFBF9|nr:PHP domain-containing protein [Paludicola sp. MB14-C6]WMJ23396.1 PHP domain-containing protein [Paludicola sp. MB14-C6]